VIKNANKYSVVIKANPCAIVYKLTRGVLPESVPIGCEYFFVLMKTINYGQVFFYFVLFFFTPQYIDICCR